ncbi:hypothetical protein V1477_000547 [Vespula maculifrons]|uniref:Uncharacterized protein n=1 Tax=Vespula maculifrons TaxID=7453 RepID=A0ABD2D1Y5_VESMC
MVLGMKMEAAGRRSIPNDLYLFGLVQKNSRFDRFKIPPGRFLRSYVFHVSLSSNYGNGAARTSHYGVQLRSYLIASIPSTSFSCSNNEEEKKSFARGFKLERQFAIAVGFKIIQTLILFTRFKIDHMFVFKGDKSDNSWETFKYKISLKTTRIDLAEEIERGIRINRRERQTMVCPPTKTHRLNWDRFRTGVLLRYDLRSVQNPEHSIFYPSKSEDYFLFPTLLEIHLRFCRTKNAKSFFLFFFRKTSAHVAPASQTCLRIYVGQRRATRTSLVVSLWSGVSSCGIYVVEKKNKEKKE